MGLVGQVRTPKVRRIVGLMIVAIVVIASTGAAQAHPAKVLKSWSPFPLPRTRSVSVHDVTGRAPHTAVAMRSAPSRNVLWPSAQTARLAVTRAAALRTTASHVEGTVPIRLTVVQAMTKRATPRRPAPATPAGGQITPSASGALDVRVVSHAAAARANVNGVLWSLTAADQPAVGAVNVTFDYRAIAGAFGGGYGTRLRLVRLPACALTTPTLARCRVQTPVPGARNDSASQELTGTVTVPGSGTRKAASGAPTASPAVVLAASSAPTGGAGSYTATSLAPSGSWSAGGNTGAFTYGYPITVPPSVGGAAPSVALSYSSASVDGRNSATNSQASWVGDGWEYAPGFIERSYKTCSDDGQASTIVDECWAGDNATLSLNGISSRLVPTGSSNQWRLKDDDGSIVDQVSVPSASAFFNGLNGGTYWRVTTNDGTQYFFGANHLPPSAGGAGTDTSTNAAWGVPVFGDDAGEPCHGASFDASRCTQGWRWNLDFVVDPHANITTYRYASESNYYAAGTSHTGVAYVRGGYPTTISYGQRVSDYVAGTVPGARVSFAVVERCDATSGFDCATGLTSATKSHWPDVPFDQLCATAANCSNYAPTFFTRKALSTITTTVWDRSLATPGWSTADTYTLSAPAFPPPGDAGQSGGTAAPALWLNSISHIGNDTRGGGVATAPLATSFVGLSLPNRVNGMTLPNVPPINRFRISSITTETGSEIDASYDTTTACSRVNAPVEDADVTRCFPVRWTPVGYSTPQLDWFTTYPVTQVSVKDSNAWGTSQSPSQITSYAYTGPAWHRDDNDFTPSNTRSWGRFRGYQTVIVTSGASPDPITKTVTQYLQGMSGDYKKDGTHPATADIIDASGNHLTDSEPLAGFAYQSTIYAANGGAAQEISVNRPWLSAAIATQSFTGQSAIPDLLAQYTDTDRTDTRQLLADGSWRVARVLTRFDPATGLPTEHDDLGEIDAAGTSVGGTTAESCTHTDYAADPARNMRRYPELTVTTAGACTATVGTNTLAAMRSFYGGSSTLGQLNGPGDVTSSQALKQAPSTWATATATVYDAYGRPTRATDPMGRRVDTSYGSGSAANNLPVTVTTTSYPLGAGNPGTTWTASVTLDPLRQLPVASTDINGNLTSETYDGLGRLTQVWLPNHPQANNAGTPTQKYAYAVSTTGYTTVTGSALRDDNNYSVDVKIYDGMLQLRQEQITPATGARGARMVADTGYDSHGWTAFTDQAFYNTTGSPSTTPVAVTAGTIPNRTTTTYDGRGQPIRAAFYSNGTFEWETDTTYPGADEVDVAPPTGGTPTSTITDARGHTTQLRQYHGSNPTGAYDVTDYGYDAFGRQTKLVGPLASTADPNASPLTWTTSYDALGDIITQADPDTGTTHSTYNDNKQLTSTTDGSTPAITVGYHYDPLGRKDYTYNGTDTASKIASWSYDPARGKGLLATAKRYTADGSTVTYTDAITGYTATGKPTGQTITIPAGQYGNSNPITYSTTNTYTPVLDALYTQVTTDTGASSLLGTSETYGLSYNPTGLPVASGGAQSYETNTSYDPHGRVVRATAGAMPLQTAITNSWDEPTGRLANTTTNKEDATAAVDNITYSYSQAGQLTSATNREDGGATAAVVDQQCYTYDYLDRLTNAWTANDGTTPADPLSNDVGAVGACTTANPATALHTGPAGYWETYAYDLTGNRTSKSSRTIAADGTVAATSTAAENYTNAAGGGPHALNTFTTGATATTYSYNAGKTSSASTTVNGNADASKTQSLSWNSTGQLARLLTGPIAVPTSDTTYDYDADGNLAARSTTTGGVKTTTVYLGNDTLTITASGITSQAVRSYPFPGGPTYTRVATNAATVLHYQCSDPHGTGITDITADTLTVTRRTYTPYGETRASTTGPGWAGDRGYVGGTTDPANQLTNLGAREYSPALGRFLSNDPLLSPFDPQQANGFSYADDNPSTKVDPNGLRPICNGGECSSSVITNWQQAQQQAENADPLAGIANSSSSLARYHGTSATVIIKHFDPGFGNGIIRIAAFIPGARAWNEAGDNRGYDARFNPEQARVAVYLDLSRGIAVFRQNPSCKLYTAHCNAGTPETNVKFDMNGNLTVSYKGYDGVEDAAQSTGASARAMLVFSRDSHGQVHLRYAIRSMYPAIEIYHGSRTLYRGGASGVLPVRQFPIGTAPGLDTVTGDPYAVAQDPPPSPTPSAPHS